MDIRAPEALALELHPHSPTHWVATFYPLARTPAGNWADVTRVLHQCLMPLARRSLSSARWLAVEDPDPGHADWNDHPAWNAALAAGYATARLVHATETAGTTGVTLSPEEARRLRAATAVVPAGQLAEWLLDDLQDVEQ